MEQMSLTEWYLEKWDNFSIIWGRVNNHPKLENGALIHTSPIKEAVLNEKEKCLNFLTNSGSNYTVSFDEIDEKPESVEKTKISLQNLNLSISFLEEAVWLSQQKEKAFQKELSEELLNGDLYLEVGESCIIKAYFKYNDELFRLNGRCHSGMFKDSYLYTKGGIVDFRHYEFGWRSFNTYHISDTVERLAVNNISGVVMLIDGKEYPVGKTISYITQDNHEEGLISPDAVNGKSMFADFDFGKGVFEDN